MLFGRLLLLTFFITPIITGAAEYDIDANDSRIVVRVYRAGALKEFGHNHIISTSTIGGRIDYDSKRPERTRFSLSIPVTSFEVDNKQLRSRAGEQFSTAVDDSAREGTRSNMLGRKVLQVDRFPAITISNGLIKHTGDGLFAVELNISIRDTSRSLTVPVEFSEHQNTLTATASFSLLQSDFGIKPLKAALGTIAVADKLDIETRIVARTVGNNQK